MAKTETSAKRPNNVHFVGTSKKDLKALPKGARAVFGFAILLAERGMMHPNAKPLAGFGGAGVLEVVEDLEGDTYRAVYTVKFGMTVYVLHAFKKKSKVGSKTPARDMELIVKRFKEAQQHHRKNYLPKGKSRSWRVSEMADKGKITSGSGNVFEDLGLDLPQEHYVKAHLVILVTRMIEAQGLTQAQAAARMGLRQPDVSKLLRGRFEGFSLERLLYFVRSLGSDIEIKVKPSKPRREGRILIAAQ